MSFEKGSYGDVRCYYLTLFPRHCFFSSFSRICGPKWSRFGIPGFITRCRVRAIVWMVVTVCILSTGYQGFQSGCWYWDDNLNVKDSEGVPPDRGVYTWLAPGKGGRGCWWREGGREEEDTTARSCARGYYIITFSCEIVGMRWAWEPAGCPQVAAGRASERLLHVTIPKFMFSIAIGRSTTHIVMSRYGSM